MNKKIQSTNKKLKMPRLFREDLISIEEIITGELKPREYKLETAKYEYEKVDLIPKDSGVVNEFHIRTYSPVIFIDFSRNSARIYAEEDDLITIGAFEKILKILKNRERKISLWSSKVALWVAPILFGLSIPQIIELGEIKSEKLWIALSVAVLAAICWIVSFRRILYKFSVINLFFSNEKPNFFRRNKDQIILLIIGASLGAILGAILTVLIQGVYQK